MKTLNYFNLLFLASYSALALQAQEAPPDPQAPVNIRPEASDPASEKLIRNYLTVAGGADNYEALQNVVATGTLKEAGNIKTFELIELQDGRRQLTLRWRHLGRDYEELRGFDGQQAWRQNLRPEREEPEDSSGQEGLHFSRQRWLLQPFVPPAAADYVFKYQGESSVRGRPSYLIVGYGRDNERSWFYFDKETFLLVRWGGLGEIAGVKEYMDYRATTFKRISGVMLPKEIQLLAEDAKFGTIQFESILANQEIDPERFKKPASRIPVLRQRAGSPE